jgi:hypothetical protein
MFVAQRCREDRQRRSASHCRYRSILRRACRLTPHACLRVLQRRTNTELYTTVFKPCLDVILFTVSLAEFLGWQVSVTKAFATKKSRRAFVRLSSSLNGNIDWYAGAVHHVRLLPRVGHDQARHHAEIRPLRTMRMCFFFFVFVFLSLFRHADDFLRFFLTSSNCSISDRLRTKVK